MHARFGATSNIFADLSKCPRLHVFSGGGEALDRRCDGRRGLPHAVLTSANVRHVSVLPKQLVDLFVKTMVKARVPLCARENSETM